MGTSLRLEHEEGLVLAFKQVKEEYPFCLVSDGRCKAFTGNNVPTSGFVLKLGASVELSLNLSRELLIKLVILGCFLADSDSDLL